MLLLSKNTFKVIFIIVYSTSVQMVTYSYKLSLLMFIFMKYLRSKSRILLSQHNIQALKLFLKMHAIKTEERSGTQILLYKPI